MKIYRVHSQIMLKGGRSLQRTGGAGINKPFTNWKMVNQKIKSHQRVKCTFYPVNWAWKLIELEKKEPQNRTVIKALIQSTHFLAHQHIAHTTNFDKLVEWVVSCGGETFETFLDRAGGNAMYTSKMAVVEFVNALGTWVEESLLKRLHKAPFFSIMADECTDVTTIEELTICCS